MSINCCGYCVASVVHWMTHTCIIMGSSINMYMYCEVHIQTSQIERLGSPKVLNTPRKVQKHVELWAVEELSIMGFNSLDKCCA